MEAARTQGLTKHYGSGPSQARKQVLCGIDFLLRRGIAFGLIGPNGAGKTTLLKILLGVVRPSAGSVRVLGRDPEDASVRTQIGYLPERLHLPQAWTASAFLRSVARFKRVSSAEAEIDRQLERVGLRAQRQLRIETFSKGMRQRLGLAAALLGQPELLVLDEPTDGVDPKGRADVRTILQEERRRGATIFLNSHLLSESERICDEIGILVGGRMLRQGGLLELTRDETRWSARFAPGADARVLVDAGFTEGPAPGVFQCGGDAVELDQRLAGARAGGALLIELTPMLHDLETVLLGLIEDQHD